MFTLHSADLEDSQAIHSLVRRAGINPTGLDWQRFQVATTPEGQVIGCGQIKPHRDGSHELASIVVADEWRHNGIGRAIIERLLDSHPGDLYLMCRSGLKTFYEKFGFQAVQIDDMPKYFRRISKLVRLLTKLSDQGETLLVMKRPSSTNQ